MFSAFIPVFVCLCSVINILLCSLRHLSLFALCLHCQLLNVDPLFFPLLSSLSFFFLLSSPFLSLLLSLSSLLSSPFCLSFLLSPPYCRSEVIKWFAERADMIIVMFDAHKLDISDELKTVLDVLKPHQDKIRYIHWLIYWLTGDWLTDWYTDWLTKWLTDWLTGWLTDFIIT